MRKIEDFKHFHQLVSEIIKLFFTKKKKQFTLEMISYNLNVDKRKIYDIINILNTIDLIGKVTKGVYQWNGLEQSVRFLESLPDYENLSV